ncbi:MAG: proline--tRNA ligase [Candidatus Woesearchaeota archaeon]
MAEKEESEVGITVKKSDDFSEWYQQLIIKSGLADYSSVSGCIVFRPDSYDIWEKIKSKVDSDFRKSGIRNCYFPLFIPERLLKKESEHMEGFSPEVAWVTESGDTKLNERLAIRPTSETIMYESFSKWIRSWRDLPLRLNQWNNVVRWEFKHPVPFLRTREFLWNEGHTVFASKQEAEAEADEIISIYKDVTENYMALPALIGRKTDKEKFAGAEYTISFEHVLPNGKAIQGPDFHHDGQNFAKAFDIKFINKAENLEFAYQNTFAITTRMIGIMVAVHSDDKGLVLPPMLAPTQIVIVPIIFEKTKEATLKKAKELKDALKQFSVILDDRDEYSAGWKFNEWELKGVPLRLEIGPKDIEKRQVMLVRRDTSKKQPVPIADLKDTVKEVLDDIQKSLFDKAKKLMHDTVVEASNFEQLKNAVDNNKIVLAPYCDNSECEDLIKDKAGGAKALNIPLKQPSIKGKKCVYCGKEASFMVYFGKSY